MREPVRVAAIGLGRWANVLAEAYRESRAVELVSCYSRDPEKRRRFAERFGCSAEESLEALLRRTDVEGVIVTVPNDQHRPVIEAAVAAGKHVYVEKPIAVDLADACAIAKAVEEAGVVFLCGHSARRLGGLREMKRQMDAGMLGQVSMVEAVFANERGLELKPGDWRGDPAKAPGGPLTQLGIHQIDNLQFLLGPVAEVFAYGKPLYTRVANLTVVQVVLEFENGTLGYLGANWTCPGVFYVRLYGTSANLFYQLDFSWWAQSAKTDDHSSLERQEFASMGDDPDRRVLRILPVSFPRTNHLREEIEEFARAVRGEAHVEVGAAEAVRNVAVLAAAVRSAEEGRPVRVAEVL